MDTVLVRGRRCDARHEPPTATNDNAPCGYSKVDCMGIRKMPTEPSRQGMLPVGGFKRWPAVPA